MGIQFNNQLYIVRHGEADNNVLGIESCKIDTQQKYGLTDAGKQTVEKEVQQYTDFQIIYASPFRRTQETAAYFAKSSACEVLLDDRLVDIDLGELDECTYEQSHATTQEKENSYVFPGGESFEQCLRRAIECIREIDELQSNKKILLVSHGFVCEAVLDWVHGKPLQDWDECIEKGRVFSLA